MFMGNLWKENTPTDFWCCQTDPPAEETWRICVTEALSSQGMLGRIDDVEDFLQLTLGEGQFGPAHWDIGRTLNLYYRVKPFLPRVLINYLKKLNHIKQNNNFLLGWPFEERYVCYLWDCIHRVLIHSNRSSTPFRYFWPAGYRFAFVLTHDVETSKGQDFVRAVTDLEEEMGFRSSFNFVPEGYKLDLNLIQELRDRGFEVGVHGLYHDGNLFSSHKIFIERARRINFHLKELGSVGFRSPLTHRNPEWMQELDIEYDLSFFDTDPYEPMPGGCMNIWPYKIGRFIELPYTLAQDSTLRSLGEKSPRLWMDKLVFILSYNGMALLNSHPDYLKEKTLWDMYIEFLGAVSSRGDYWNALPQQVARWWRVRTGDLPPSSDMEIETGVVSLDGDHIQITYG